MFDNVTMSVYLYACRIVKQKLFNKMTGASFPVIFVKAYRDWILDEKGLNLQTMPSWKLSNNKHDKKIHTKIFINPTLFQQLSSGKNKNEPPTDGSTCNVILRCTESRGCLQVTAVSLAAVPGNQIWCSYLAASNIQQFFTNLCDKKNPIYLKDAFPKYFLTPLKTSKSCGSSSSDPVLAAACQVLVFKTPEVKELDGEILAGLIAAFICEKGAYFTNNQISRIDTRYLKCKEILHLDQNLYIYIQTQFTETGSSSTKSADFSRQYYIDPSRTRVTQQFCINARLPRNFASSPPFAFDVFSTMLKLAENNFAEDLRHRRRLRLLLVGEVSTGRDRILQYLAKNLGLDYMETSCHELVADTSAVTENNIVRCIGNLSSCMPTLWNLQDIDSLVQDKEGHLDQRVLHALQVGLNDLNPKIILVGTSSSKERIPGRLYTMFLEVLQMPATVKTQERTSCIKRIVSEEYFELEQESLIPWLSEKTAGYSYEDLRSVLNSSAVIAAMRESYKISSDCLEKSLAKWRAARSKLLGLAEVPNVKWEDIGGLEDVKAEILEAVSNIGVSGSKRCGLLLYGPPGVGKTLLAKAAATQCAMSFISVKGPELLNMYVGQSEENVRTIFKRAKEAEPCIVFFDELDSVAPARGQAGDSGGVMDRVVSALLAELDSLDQIQVIVIGATNRPDLLDPALTRPGRFDKSIYIGTATDPEQQLSILKSQTRKLNLAPDCDLKNIVSSFPENISGAQVSGIVSNAALRAVERCILHIQRRHLIDEQKKRNNNKQMVKNEVEMVTMDDFMHAVHEFKDF